MICRNRETKKGGGVAILISNLLSSRARYDLTLGDDCESIFAEVKLGQKQAVVCSAYCPPNTDCREFIKSFDTNVKETEKTKKHYVDYWYGSQYGFS